MIGSAEDEGSFEGLLQLLVINLSFSVLEDLSALVVHDQPEDDTIALMPDMEGDVVTLTHLPRSRWQTLLNLDVIQVSLCTFLCNSYALTLWITSNETNQKSPQRLQRRHHFSCLLFQASKRGLWSKRKKKRRRQRRSLKRLSQMQRVSSSKNCRKSPEIAIVGAMFFLRG